MNVQCTLVIAGVTPMGKLAAYWNIPVMSYRATGEILSDKRQFPTLASVAPTKKDLAKIIAEFIEGRNIRQPPFLSIQRRI